jgi:hypothetical protein
MKLVALKRISSQLLAGAVFEQPLSHARILIAMGIAREYKEEIQPVRRGPGRPKKVETHPGVS